MPRPPQAARTAAKNALAKNSKLPPSKKAGTSVGLGRARDIAAGKNLSPSTISRMNSFFARHGAQMKGRGTPKQQIAWGLWGGSAGKAWAKSQSKKKD